MRTVAEPAGRAAVGPALAAAVAGVAVEWACPWPRGHCVEGGPALIFASLGSFSLAAGGVARACRWFLETPGGPDEPADAGPPESDRHRYRFAEG